MAVINPLFPHLRSGHPLFQRPSSQKQIPSIYDPLGQLTSADSTVTGQDRAYQYDAIGNRKKSADSLTLPVTDNYTANSLNQYSVEPVNGGSSISPAYDFDGNATAYPVPVAPSAISTLGWDAENRLISSTVSGTTTVYQYDAGGRRVAKTTGTTTQLSLYDGWKVVAEYSKIAAASATLQKTNLWGMDLSGSMQGAGGVGGLLSVSSLTTSSPMTFTSYFATCDGNGNVSEYLAATGAVSAHFEYDSFGRSTIDTDTIGQSAYRFSTKAYDTETGLSYYGYRYYDSTGGRWISRDIVHEVGGLNLYGFGFNHVTSGFDPNGKSWAGDSMVKILGPIPRPIDKFLGTSDFFYDQINKIGEGLGEGYAGSGQNNNYWNKVLSFDLGKTVTSPFGGHISVQAVAFLAECKFYFYGVMPIAGAKSSVNFGSLDGLRLQSDISANAIEAAGGVAYWKGTKPPTPENWEGEFYGVGASFGIRGLFSGSVGIFADPENKWSGYDVGVGYGKSALPASITTTPDYYTLIKNADGSPKEQKIPCPVCKVMRKLDPVGHAMTHMTIIY